MRFIENTFEKRLRMLADQDLTDAIELAETEINHLTAQRMKLTRERAEFNDRMAVAEKGLNDSTTYFLEELELLKFERARRSVSSQDVLAISINMHAGFGQMVAWKRKCCDKYPKLFDALQEDYLAEVKRVCFSESPRYDLEKGTGVYVTQTVFTLLQRLDSYSGWDSRTVLDFHRLTAAQVSKLKKDFGDDIVWDLAEQENL